MESAALSLLLGRVLFGGFFLFAGMNHVRKMDMLTAYAQSKGVAVPQMAVVASGLLFLAGGAGIAFGVFVPWAVLSLVAALLPISFRMHDFWNISDPGQKAAEMSNFLKNMALIGGALLALAVPAPWPLSLF